MQKRTKISIFLIIILSVIGTCAFILSNRWTHEFRQLLNDEGSIEHVQVKDVVLTETKDGEKYWEIYSAIGEYDSEQIKATLTDVVGNYYNHGEVVMSFTAPTGYYDSATKEVGLNSGVRIVGKDGIQVTADKVYWVTTTNKIKAEGNIVINGNDSVIGIGDKGVVTTDFKTIELLDNAEIRVYTNKGSAL